MEIKSFKKLKDNRYKVVMDDESIILYDDIIVKYNLLANKMLDDKKFALITQENSKLGAYYRALKSLRVKMRTKSEIEKLLAKEGFDKKIINDTINRLYIEKYLDDNLYIKAYLADEINLKDIGPLKIIDNLKKLGFNEDIYKDKVYNIDEKIWMDKIDKYINKKIKTNNMSARRLKEKIIMDLYYKGFNKEMILDVLNNYEIINYPNTVLKEYEKIKLKLEKKYSGTELLYRIKIKMLEKGYNTEDIANIENIEQ